MIHIEYVCFKCGETYLPAEPGDEHDVREDGTECNGLGYFSGIHFVSISPPELAELFKLHDPFRFNIMVEKAHPTQAEPG